MVGWTNHCIRTMGLCWLNKNLTAKLPRHYGGITVTFLDFADLLCTSYRLSLLNDSNWSHLSTIWRDKLGVKYFNCFRFCKTSLIANKTTVLFCFQYIKQRSASNTDRYMNSNLKCQQSVLSYIPHIFNCIYQVSRSLPVQTAANWL